MPDGSPLHGDFEAQTRQSFANIETFLKQCGGSLADIVQMTVFIMILAMGRNSPSCGKEYFPDGNFPGQRSDYMRRVCPTRDDGRDTGDRRGRGLI